MLRPIRLPLLALLAGVVLFLFAQYRLEGTKRARVNSEIDIALPLFVQVLMAGGDRYLAASWATVRALVTETSRMKPDEYTILAKVQQDASWLNPGHEDNYYIAAAILPWEGHLEPAQIILRRATLARPFDYQPPFYYAFHLVHFKQDAFAAAEWLRRAAVKLPNPDERVVMESFAARWLDRTQDLDLAARVVDAMAAQTRNKGFADYLRGRSQRLRDLAMLRRAATDYQARYARPPRSFDELKAAGLIMEVPIDPLGSGFVLDEQGVPAFSKVNRQ